MTQSSPEALQRAAILVAALEPDLADRLLDQMPSDEAARLRRAIMELGDVDSSQERDVIDTFLARDSASSSVATTPSDEAISSAPVSAEDEGVELYLSQAGSSQSLQVHRPSPPDFQFLQNVDRTQLIELLASEQPRTVAIVAAQLPEDRAASLLTALLPATRDEVVRRFSEPATTDPEVIAEIERSLRARLAPGAAVTARPLADEQKISRVLTAVDAEANQPATEPEDSPRLASSQHHGANVSEPNVDPLALTFADLEYLDAELLSVTLQKARADLVCLALAGAKSSFVQTVLNRLSLREARSLRRQMESLGPTRLSDMERAQHELAQLAEMVLIAALQGTGVGPTARS